MLSSSTKKIMFISVLHVRNFNVNKLEVKLMKIFIFGKFYEFFFLINCFFLIIAQSWILNFVIFNFNRLKYIYRYIRSNYMKKYSYIKLEIISSNFIFITYVILKYHVLYIRVNKFHFIIFNWLFFPNTNVIY